MLDIQTQNENTVTVITLNIDICSFNMEICRIKHGIILNKLEENSQKHSIA